MIFFANPKEQYLSYKDEIKESIDRVLESGWYILGEEVKLFEKEFLEFVGTKYCLGVASGTDALFLSLKSLEIGLGDEVIAPSHTATATISAIEATGAKVVFADIEEEYFTIDPKDVEKKINSKTKAIVAVHLYGQACDMDNLIKIAQEKKIYLIEDCAQANGAKYKGHDVGSIGDLGCFSFFPTKNLGAIGDGGAITTNSEKIYEKLLMLRQYGWDNTRETYFQGYNSRLDELQAAILRVKLKYLREDIKKRNKIASFYNECLSNLNLSTPKVRENCLHAYHLYVIESESRDSLLEYLKKENIIAMIHYSKPVHLNSLYKSKNVSLNKTEELVKNILSLPMYPELSEEDCKKICKIIKENV